MYAGGGQYIYELHFMRISRILVEADYILVHDSPIESYELA